jgi:sugar O-acyltransferase (sialic acid O-acetyltransferase NeuD family)
MAKETRKPLVVVGAGGLGREVAWLVTDINRFNPEWKFLGFVDDGVSGLTVEEYPILGPISHLFEMNPRPFAVIAIADCQARFRILGKMEQEGLQMATLIHPSVQMSDFVSIGSGSIICAGSTITTNVTLGKACIVNPNGFVGHDTVLSNCVSMMPAANVAGEVFVGTGCCFGMNSCVINRTRIGEWSVIGAGATVTEDIPPYSLAVGVPARVVRKLA